MNKTNYKQTINGLLRTIYDMQTSHSITRKHPPPEYTVEDFIAHMIKSSIFARLYVDWVSSGYNKNKRPSANRLCDYTPYTIKNIEILTFEENRLQANKDMISGKNNKQNTSVEQYTLDGIFVKSFHSIAEAKRITGFSHISSVCSGKRNHAGGFKWKHTKGKK